MEKMNRKDFISKLGIGAAFVLTATCLGSCKDDGDSTPETDVDFTLDLTQTVNAALLVNGGYVIKNNVVVAKTMDGEFVAATIVCSHENRSEVIYKDDEFYCTAHGARFNQSGGGLNTNGSKGLTTYQTSLDVDILRVFS